VRARSFPRTIDRLHCDVDLHESIVIEAIEMWVMRAVQAD